MLKSKAKIAVVEQAPGHFSWTLVDCKDVSVKLEEIPPGGKSEFHFHKKSLQFFYILEGEAVFNLEGRSFSMKK